MNTKAKTPQEFTLVILGKELPPIRRKVFDSNNFILPEAQDGAENRKPKTRKEKKRACVQSPLSERQIEINRQLKRPNPFEHLSKAIDNSQLTLSIPHKGIKIKVEDFRKEAQKAPPERMKPNKAFDTYAKEQYGRSYSDLVNDARNEVICRFKTAFVRNLDYDPMTEEYNRDKEIFLHYPVWAPVSVIKEYKSLAKQGHVYSQYLAGVLLASSAGGYKEQCVEYLLMAYENKHPESMRVLAEFLNYKNDYYGAMQCALLSVSGGDDYSKNIVRKILGNAFYQMMQTDRGVAPLSFVIIETLRANGFDSILREHFSELNLDPQTETNIAGFLRGRHL